MGVVVAIESRRSERYIHKPADPRAALPLVLSRLLEAGATEFTRIALDAWGKRELEPEELLDLCATYAAVAGLETV
ncbi:MAG: hypothetical protein JWN15_3961 [Firmicutes bacterium]|jgi:hypothetical protein|nr:hypothetical protein [Bacillota bacterium]